MEILFAILLVVGMIYVVYQHYASPFKMIKGHQKYKKNLRELVTLIDKDEILMKRVEPLVKAMLEGKISESETADAFIVLIKERQEELNSKVGEEHYPSSNVIKSILLVIITVFVGLIIGFVAYNVTHPDDNYYKPLILEQELIGRWHTATAYKNSIYVIEIYFDGSGTARDVSTLISPQGITTFYDNFFNYTFDGNKIIPNNQDDLSYYYDKNEQTITRGEVILQKISSDPKYIAPQ